MHSEGPLGFGVVIIHGMDGRKRFSIDDLSVLYHHFQFAKIVNVVQRIAAEDQ